MSSRDWALGKIRALKTVTSAEPIAADFILIHRKDDFLNEEFPPFIAGVISAKRVTPQTLNHLLTQGQEFQFTMNIPKDAAWEGSAIALAEASNLGWGGFGELMSALGQEDVRGFEKKEYSFALNGLRQHTRVNHLVRIFDRLVEINRNDSLPPVRTVFLNEYELTADRIRLARATYGEFSAILRTNPNGGATGNASVVAHEFGAEIYQWGEFLARLNRR